MRAQSCSTQWRLHSEQTTSPWSRASEQLPVTWEAWLLYDNTNWHIETETKLTPFRWQHFQVRFRVRNFEFRLKCYWNLFFRVQLTIFKHWFIYNAWHRPCDKPLSEPMMVNLPTHIRVNQPQLVNLGVLPISLVDDLSSSEPAIWPRYPLDYVHLLSVSWQASTVLW